MTVTDELLQNAHRFAEGFDQGDLPMPPAAHVAVVACMDARLNPQVTLGLALGDAHVIRNAGGVVTDDVVRSLIISQRLLGTRHIVLVHHTDCGMTAFTDDELKAEIQADTGMKPAFSLESFNDPAENVRQSILRIETNPFIPHKDSISGFVFEVETGQLKFVAPETAS